MDSVGGLKARHEYSSYKRLCKSAKKSRSRYKSAVEGILWKAKGMDAVDRGGLLSIPGREQSRLADLARDWQKDSGAELSARIDHLASYPSFVEFVDDKHIEHINAINFSANDVKLAAERFVLHIQLAAEWKHNSHHSKAIYRVVEVEMPAAAMPPPPGRLRHAFQTLFSSRIKDTILQPVRWKSEQFEWEGKALAGVGPQWKYEPEMKRDVRLERLNRRTD